MNEFDKTPATGTITAQALPAEPFQNQQWYINYLGLPAVWADYTGAGITVDIIDDGFDLTHPDLVGKFNLALSHDYKGKDSDVQAESGNNHGTPVAGVIGAANNNIGLIGVAYDATLVGTRVSFSSDGDTTMFANAMASMAQADVANNSYGYTTLFIDNFSKSYMLGIKSQIDNAALNGRHHLGTVMVFSAGNFNDSGDNVNYHNLTNSDRTIAVGAIDATGKIVSYSDHGATVLLVAPGDAIPSTDVSGAGGYFPGDYVNVSGTSFAAPMVSAVAALMLQANPNLGYRDVQEILAYSAHKATAATDYQTNSAVNYNGGGLHFSHYYGFGILNAHDAVRLAETWGADAHTAANLQTILNTSHNVVNIPDGTGHATLTFNIIDDLIIDHVEVSLDITHLNSSQLDIVLVAPNGTRSILVDNAPGVAGFPSEFTLGSVADWGEHAKGTWTVEVYDTVTGTAGQINGWSLRLMGDVVTPNDTYIFTDELTGTITVNDTNNGVDTINAAAMTRNLSVDLNNYAAIENLFSGDGADTVRGNARSNTINTGRGNDTIIASIGHDIIDGGAGVDTYLSYDVFNASVAVNAANDITVTSLTDGTVTELKNIEHFNFAGVSYDLAGLQAASHSGQLTDVVYFVRGAGGGLAQGESNAQGHQAFTASDLHNIGGQDVVLLSDRDDEHLTLINNAASALNGLFMRSDDGLALTVHGFNEVSLVADGTHATSIDIGGGQRGFIQTGSGNDTVSFLAFLLDQQAPAQNRTLTVHSGDGADTVKIDDRSNYLVYDVDLGAGDDHFLAKGTDGGHILGGAGHDIFAFGVGNAAPAHIDDFSIADDKLDLSSLLDGHDTIGHAISEFIELTSQGADTVVKVDHKDVATLTGVNLSDSVQHYLDAHLIVIDHSA